MKRLDRRLLLVCVFLIGTVSGMNAQGSDSPLRKDPNAAFRILTWTTDGRSVFERSDDFRKVLRLADADIYLLNEIDGSRTANDIGSILRGLRNEADTRWNVVLGNGGGYQKGSISSRYPVRPVPELNRIIPYPSSDVERLKALVPEANWERTKGNLDTGIAVAGGIVQIAKRTVLAVTVDLQCCSGTPDWQDARRQIEVREIRKALQAVLKTYRVDAVVLAGDFNLVSSGTPLAMATNPYPSPHFALAPVEAFHLDGTENWTWDGRNTQFPSRPLDFKLYSPNSLEPIRAIVLSTEDLSADVLSSTGLLPGTSRALSAHLPIVVDYKWRSRK